jgi:exodeoxyribonuclease-5
VTATLTPDQATALDRVVAWFRAAPASRYCDDERCEPGPHTHGGAPGHPVLAIGGLAGSGKTFLAGQLAGVLGCQVAYGTPTHRAAAVLRGKLPEAERGHVRTYHSLLYRPAVSYTCELTGEPVTRLACGCRDPEDCLCDRRFTPCGAGDPHDCPVREHLRFTLREHVGGHRDLVVLDEASMLSEQTVREVASLAVPVLLVGDHGQLSPVMEDMNPWMRNPGLLLVTNHRQTEASGIVAAALHVRETGRLALGGYGDGSTVVASAWRDPAILDVASPARLPPGPDRVVITHTNRMRAAINARYRDGFEGPLVAGDRVVALQNADRVVVAPAGGDAWRATGAVTFVFNGTVGTVEHVTPPRQASQRWLDAVIRLDADQRGRPDTRVQCRVTVAQLGAERRLRPDEHAVSHALWDHAYAVTAHKAQGSEYDDVVVVDTHPPEWRRWIYTAMTRAKNRLVVINWNQA